jgi:predicted RNA binding protein YcfA (HicA-like mRNA interferase family)
MGKTKQMRLQGRDPILKKARKLGFIITPGGNHWLVKHPKGGTVIVSYNGHNKRSRILELKTDQDLEQIVERHKND